LVVIEMQSETSSVGGNYGLDGVIHNAKTNAR